jgi:hypothetical protein
MLSILSNSLSQNHLSHYDDGPYVFFDKGRVEVNWVKDGQLKDTSYTMTGKTPNLSFINPHGIRYEKFIKSEVEPDRKTVYTDVKCIAAMSDIHGQYDLMIELLKNNHIINEKGHWSFEDCHFVITGDIFDRGDRVLEILWFLIGLEAEAEAAGGKVHVMLGNHEVMILQRDLRYIHRKYQYTSSLFRKPYSELFEDDSFLGQWLRSKPIYIKINDIGFVHGGINESIFSFGFPIEELNEIYFDKVLSHNKIHSLSRDRLRTYLLGEDGPLWYRGYADVDKYDIVRTDNLLEKMNVNHVIVGHTSMPNILSLWDKKIIFIDSSIKLGKGGEMLLVNGNEFIRADKHGNQIKL